MEHHRLDVEIKGNLAAGDKATNIVDTETKKWKLMFFFSYLQNLFTDVVALWIENLLLRGTAPH